MEIMFTQNSNLSYVKLSTKMNNLQKEEGDRNTSQVVVQSSRLMVNKCLVDVVQDNMVNVACKYDVIVNSTGSNITGGGASSKAIFAAGGQPLLDHIAV